MLITYIVAWMQYNHARGAGFLMRKCNFPLSKVLWRVTGPLYFTLLFIVQGRAREAVCFPGVSLGRTLGYLGSLRIHQKTLQSRQP